jgi:hypothetical protein
MTRTQKPALPARESSVAPEAWLALAVFVVDVLVLVILF